LSRRKKRVRGFKEERVRGLAKGMKGTEWLGVVKKEGEG
jgi:hypothetical protein